MTMTKNQGPPRKDQVYISISICIENPGTVTAGGEKWSAAYSFQSPDRAIDATWDYLYSPLHRSFRAFQNQTVIISHFKCLLKVLQMISPNRLILGFGAVFGCC
jgi:hypothetical protein